MLYIARAQHERSRSQPTFHPGSQKAGGRSCSLSKGLERRSAGLRICIPFYRMRIECLIRPSQPIKPRNGSSVRRPSRSSRSDANTVPEAIGWCLNLYAGGIVVSWASVYFNRIKDDKRLIRWLVHAVTFLSLASAALSAACLVQHMLDQDRTLAGMDRQLLPNCLNALCAAFTAAIVESFFASRCYKVRRNGLT